MECTGLGEGACCGMGCEMGGLSSARGHEARRPHYLCASLDQVKQSSQLFTPFSAYHVDLRIHTCFQEGQLPIQTKALYQQVSYRQPRSRSVIQSPKSGPALFGQRVESVSGGKRKDIEGKLLLQIGWSDSGWAESQCLGFRAGRRLRKARKLPD